MQDYRREQQSRWAGIQNASCRCWCLTWHPGETARFQNGLLGQDPPKVEAEIIKTLSECPPLSAAFLKPGEIAKKGMFSEQLLPKLFSSEQIVGCSGLTWTELLAASAGLMLLICLVTALRRESSAFGCPRRGWPANFYQMLKELAAGCGSLWNQI